MDKRPVGITGVWVAGSNGRIAVAVEVDGQWRQIQSHVTTDGVISHITEPAGIMAAPVVEIPKA